MEIDLSYLEPSKREMDIAEGLRIEELKRSAQRPLPDPDEWLEEEIKQHVLMTTVDTVLTWARSRSIFPLMFGLACCA